MSAVAAVYKNGGDDGKPIVIHQLIIRRGIQNNQQKGLKQELESIFSQYGRIWSYETSGTTLVFIGYDNEKSRELAVANQNGKQFMNLSLLVASYFSKFFDGFHLLPLKLNNPDIDINTLTNCNNYWNKQLYPENIVQYGLKNGIAEVRETAGRFIILCYHKDISYPFAIQMASENRMKEHIIHIRPQTLYEITLMLRDVDISLLKQLLSRSNAFNYDWCHGYGINVLAYYTQQDMYPYHRVKYMIDIIKCDTNNHNLLHIAANRHDIRLINLFLNDYGINPLLRDRKWNKTALEECNFAWTNYQKKLARNANNNIIQFITNDNDNDNDDIKQNSSSFDNVYIKSILLEDFLYIQNYGNVSFFSVAEPYKKYAQFSLQCINTKNNVYVICVKYGSKSHKRICSLKGFTNLKSDIVLTADIDNKTVEFLPPQQIKENLCLQHWFIQKEVKGNEKGYTFSVKINNDQQYQLFATNDNKPKLQIIDNNKNKEEKIEEEEGCNFNDTMKSWFIIMREPEFEKEARFEWWQKNDYRSFLRGDMNQCQRIHDAVVKRLEDAMKIEKLHGDTKGNDQNNQNKQNIEEKNDENNVVKSNKKYRAKKVVHKYVTPYNNNNNNNYKYKGVCKKWNDKGYGFITVSDGSGDVFVHRNEIKSGYQSILYVGENVQFDIVTQDDGRRKAVNVIASNRSSSGMQQRNYYHSNYNQAPPSRYNNNSRFRF